MSLVLISLSLSCVSLHVSSGIVGSQLWTPTFANSASLPGLETFLTHCFAKRRRNSHISYFFRRSGLASCISRCFNAAGLEKYAFPTLFRFFCFFSLFFSPLMMHSLRDLRRCTPGYVFRNSSGKERSEMHSSFDVTAPYFPLSRVPRMISSREVPVRLPPPSGSCQ